MRGISRGIQGIGLLLGAAVAGASGQGLFGLAAGGSSVGSLVAAEGPELHGPPAPATTRVAARVEVAGPGAREVRVEVRVQDYPNSTLTLGMPEFAAPGVRPTREAYGIDESLRVTSVGEGGEEVPFRWVRGEDAGPRGQVALEIESPPRGGVQLEYVLRLEGAAAPGGEGAAPEWKDRVRVEDRFALLRGDTLLLPLGPLAEATVELQGPSQWRHYMPLQRLGGTRFDLLRSDSRPWDWIGMLWKTSEFTGRRGRHDGLMYSVVTDLGDDPERGRQVHETVFARVEALTKRFGGVDVATPMEESLHYPQVRVIVVQAPAGATGGTGGQYLPGLAYLTYSPEEPQAVGHVAAHEVFHAWNDGALMSPEDSTGLSWWVEGYTDLQAWLVDTELGTRDPRERYQRLQERAGQAFGVASGLDRPPGAEAPDLASDPAMTEFSLEGEGFQEQYDRLVQQRPLLVLMRLATILGRDRVDQWFLRVQRRHGHARGKRPYSNRRLKKHLLKVAGEDADEVRELFETYIEDSTPITEETMREWMRDRRWRSLVLARRGPHGI